MHCRAAHAQVLEAPPRPLPLACLSKAFRIRGWEQRFAALEQVRQPAIKTAKFESLTASFYHVTVPSASLEALSSGLEVAATATKSMNERRVLRIHQYEPGYIGFMCIQGLTRFVSLAEVLEGAVERAQGPSHLSVQAEASPCQVRASESAFMTPYSMEVPTQNSNSTALQRTRPEGVLLFCTLRRMVSAIAMVLAICQSNRAQSLRPPHWTCRSSHGLSGGYICPCNVVSAA